MTSVSHRPELIASLVDFKLHDYQILLQLALFNRAGYLFCRIVFPTTNAFG